MPSIETKSGKSRRKKRHGKTSVTVETKSEEDFFEGLDVGDALEPEKIGKDNEPAASNPMMMRRLRLQKSSMCYLSLCMSLPVYLHPVLHMFLCIKIISYFVYAHTHTKKYTNIGHQCDVILPVSFDALGLGK